MASRPEQPVVLHHPTALSSSNTTTPERQISQARARHSEVNLCMHSPTASSRITRRATSCKPAKFDVVVQIITTLLRACHTPASVKAFQRVLDDKAMAEQVRALDQHKQRQFYALSPAAFTWKPMLPVPSDDEDAPLEERDCLHALSDQDRMLPSGKALWDKMIQEARTTAATRSTR